MRTAPARRVFYASSCKYIDSGSAPAVSAQASSASAPRATYDEQFTLRDGEGRALADTYYTARMPAGELQHGATDSQGRTTRYETDGAQSIRIYLGHKQEV
ncbi:hypothetical protein [Paraburkholderia sp. BL10I2N1]|uniref:hypothetical protein n=1 Tax=Paraburkholderia sp. BL10I2N1 TaxID=1938796 RepID=UPI00105D84CB|nr:hypothetical protein [Paraburkholderia sp. BL10I2N1]